MLALRGTVFPRRPGRIDGFAYIGLHRYSVTICTHLRKSIFADRTSDESGADHDSAMRRVVGFAIHALLLMFDHVHLVVAATGEQSDFQRFMSNWKQRAGYQHRKRTGESLWQDSYHDHVLRDDEEMARTVRYVLENPVRKGLVARVLRVSAQRNLTCRAKSN